MTYPTGPLEVGFLPWGEQATEALGEALLCRFQIFFFLLCKFLLPCKACWVPEPGNPTMVVRGLHVVAVNRALTHAICFCTALLFCSCEARVLMEGVESDPCRNACTHTPAVNACK